MVTLSKPFDRALRFEIPCHALSRNWRPETVWIAGAEFILEVLPPGERKRIQAASSTALLVQYAEHPYAGSRRLRFVLKRRLHQDSIESQTELPGSLSTEWWAPMPELYAENQKKT
jgi:hypothetical protein